MPSLTAYTPYETLAFCQSVARHGADTPAFEDIAKALNTNQLIRENQAYDHTRLTAAALRELYQGLLVEEKNSNVPQTNGDNVNPRKRKLSASPPPENGHQTDEILFESLVDRLYAGFREQTIKEIRVEEEAYVKLEAEILELENKIESEQQEQSVVEEPKIEAPSQTKEQTEDGTLSASDSRPSPDLAAAQLHASLDASRAEQAESKPELPATEVKASTSPSQSAQQPPVAASASPAPSTLSITTVKAPEAGQGRQPQPASHPPHHSPGAFHRTLPTPSPQRPNYGPINPQHYQPGPQGQPVPVLPGMPGVPHMPPPPEMPGHKRGSTPSGQGRGSPIPMPPQQAYPGYPGYPPPPWPHQMPSQHQYPQPPYGNAPYYVQSPTGRPGMPYQTPHHPPYQPYPQSAPGHYQGQPPPPHGWHPPYGQPYYGYPGPANVTPVPRSDSRRQLIRGRSSTPWKKRVDSGRNGRQSSPVRPERDVSPLTDTEKDAGTSPQASKIGQTPDRQGQRTSGNLLSAPEASTVRGRQAASATPSAVPASRSASMASFTSEPTTEKRRRGRPPQKIKAEPPSTPAPMLLDNEQAETPSTQLDKATKETSTSRTAANKRKRSPERDSATPQLPSPPSVQIPRRTARDSSLVAVSKNFAKTSQLLLNEILSHKLAGIFAKPLSERDAPGYKDLVHRPQDLKSIKAAISRGGKAALAAIEALENEDESEDDTPKKNNRSAPPTADTVREGPIGNGVYLVKVTEDLVPPRGIVNSSQLEMELVRMFANAIMFNPLPTSERGFGRSLRLKRDQEDIDSDDEEETSESDVTSSGQGTPADEGGIISDTREMFEDVLAQIRRWREDVERLGDDDGGTGPKTGHAGSGSGSGPPAASAHQQLHGNANASATASARHSSVGSGMNDEGGGAATTTAEVATPVPTTGTARKRRRIAEN
ncbi:hypothetical protein ABEF95_004909 [Exophiala dermatitidis]